MRIVIATTQTLFAGGDGERLAAALAAALRAAGHEAAIAAIPFNPQPERVLDQMLACRMLDLGSRHAPADRLICLDFPAYFVSHPHKILWLLHQYRPAYAGGEDGPGEAGQGTGEAQTDAVIRDADRNVIPEARLHFAVSRTAARRLKAGCGIEAAPLFHPPPGAERFGPGEYGDYVLVPEGAERPRRRLLVLAALERARQPVRACFLGTSGGEDDDFRKRLAASPAGERLMWRGDPSSEERAAAFADCRAVITAPLAADNGDAAFEAMLAAKAIITCGDAGAPAEFVRDGETGLVRAPDAKALADALDRLWLDRPSAAAFGRAALDHYRALDISWEHAVSCLLV